MSDLKLIVMEAVSEFFGQNFLYEADTTGHAMDRLRERFLSENPKKVGFEISGKVGEYEVIGTKSLTPETINEIRNRIAIIEKYKFNANNSYAVKIADLYIKPETVSFNSDEDKKVSAGKTLVYVDAETASNGNHIYLIIRENKVKTVFFAKSYVNIGKDKFQVDFLIQDFARIMKHEVR